MAGVGEARILRGARRLLAREENWCKGAAARTKDGKRTKVFAGDAVQFCLNGALIKAAGRPHPPRKSLLQAIRGGGRFYGGVNGFNDSVRTTHVTVLAALDRAIEISEARP